MRKIPGGAKISKVIIDNKEPDKPMLSMERVKEYLAMIGQRSILLPLGIALCIFSVAMNIVAEALSVPEDLIGVGGMFSLIAVAVGLFIITGIKYKGYAEVKKKEVYELRGIFSSPSGKIFGIYDINSQRGFWINYHSPVNGIIADSFDEETKTLSFHSEDGKFSVQLKGVLDQSQNAGI